MNRKQRRGKGRREGCVQQVAIQQARRKWLGKTVQFDLHQGLGIQLGKVVSVSNGGDVVVECLPGYDGVVPSLMMSLGFVDQTLMLVDK